MRFLFAFFLVAALLTTPFFAAQAATQDFASWLADLRREAIASGISPHVVREALPDSLSPNEKIIRLDRRQPENTITFEKYKSNVVTPLRLREGRKKMQLHKDVLHDVSGIYDVESQYIVALWGIETGFGKNTGGFDVVPALVTLAYDGRRGSFFRKELLKALRIVDKGHISLREMKGSWAGAMGQCQFMPSSFESFAQDHDGDGRHDIWNSEADVFASASAYLFTNGWKRGEAWGHQVRLPESFDNSLIGVKVQKSLRLWRQMGIQAVDGRPFTFGEDEPVSVVQPGGKGYKAYVVGNNYRIILKWNNSTYFATSVGLLADGLKS